MKSKITKTEIRFNKVFSSWESKGLEVKFVEDNQENFPKQTIAIYGKDLFMSYTIWFPSKSDVKFIKQHKMTTFCTFKGKKVGVRRAWTLFNILNQ